MSEGIFDIIGLAVGISRVEAKDAAKHPTMYRTGSTAKNYLDQNVNNVKVDKSCFEATREPVIRSGNSVQVKSKILLKCKDYVDVTNDRSLR